MIAAGFIGLLGEATLELAPVSSYPLGPFLAALGFLATLLADYAAQALGSGGHVSTLHIHQSHPDVNKGRAAGCMALRQE